MKQIMNNKSFLTCEIYVGTYHKYNCGSLQGAWVDLTQFETHEEFMQFCKVLHSDEPDAEYMFQDFTCDPVFNKMISEYGVDKDLFEAMELYADLSPLDQQIVTALIDATNFDLFTALGKYEDLYVTNEIEAYCIELVEQMGICELGLRYFDYASFQRDFEFDLITGSCEGEDFYFYNY